MCWWPPFANVWYKTIVWLKLLKYNIQKILSGLFIEIPIFSIRMNDSNHSILVPNLDSIWENYLQHKFWEICLHRTPVNKVRTDCIPWLSEYFILSRVLHMNSTITIWHIILTTKFINTSSKIKKNIRHECILGVVSKYECNFN